MEEGEWFSAQEAAAVLGVSVATLYVYVGRKGIRSRPVSGSRERRYWKPDVEGLRRGGRRSTSNPAGQLTCESALTLITERGPFYRGQSVLELAEAASLEEVAGLLWNCEPCAVFTSTPPRTPPAFDDWAAMLTNEGSVDRALGLFPRLEQADPRAYDLSPFGMSRTGADVVRWMTAIVLRQSQPPGAPIHSHIVQTLGLDDDKASLVRRLLVLSADHGFEPGAYGVRAVASTGVTPWRTVMTGLLVFTGRRSGFGRFNTVRQFLFEILEGSDPEKAIVRRLRDGEPVPGFGSPIYAGKDPRAGALLAHCAQVFAGDPRQDRINKAAALMLDAKEITPDLAFSCMLVGHLLGMATNDSLFLIGRSVGWIAHAIEQYLAGEVGHREGQYLGPLPR
jgi:citrate synthase